MHPPISLFVMLSSLVVLIAACNQTPIPTNEYVLNSVNNKPVPVNLIDQVIQEPNQPPYRFEVDVTAGQFKLEGNRYEQTVWFREFVNGQGNSRWKWKDFGTCNVQDAVMRCDSAFFENYGFEFKQQGHQLVTQQNFTDPALKGTYTFSKGN